VSLKFHRPSPRIPAGLQDSGVPLVGACLGSSAPAGLSDISWPEQWVAAPLLESAHDGLREVWTATGESTQGSQEGIQWRRVGHMLYGVLTLEEADFAQGQVTALQAASESAYQRIFRLLEAQGLPHLWRAWNYMARINAEEAGLERYRQFNIGRQDAFLAHHRGVTGNMPAACAIGLADGPLSVAFLAGPMAAVPLENPRQISAYNYPETYGPRAPCFSRGALAYPPGQELLLVSGTASILGHSTVHHEDLLAQCRETLANIGAVLEEANRRGRSAPFALGELAYRAYIRLAEDGPEVLAWLREQLGPEVDITCLQADVCRADLLVEIEAMGIHDLPAGTSRSESSRG